MHASLRIQLYEDRNATLLVDDLSGQWQSLSFRTALHGGFKDCHMLVSTDLGRAWSYLKREQSHGHHYRHLSIQDEIGTVWEGRLTNVGLSISGGAVGLDLQSFGYWSSMRDQYYDASDAGRTDWTVGTLQKASDVIKEMITNECPQINGTADIDANGHDLTGIDLKGKNYPMDVIIDKLAPLSDTDFSVWYFGVWEKRKPYWKKRTLSVVNWYIWMRDIDQLNLVQQGMHLRNSITYAIGTGTATTFSVDADSTAIYPTREIVISLPAGISSTSTLLTDAQRKTRDERSSPRQDQSFSIKGHTYSAGVGTARGTAGGLNEMPKWWVRAGDVIRIQDLVPAGVATGTLDDVRTFYILETQYDANRDALQVQPDRPASPLGAILSRLGQLELNK